MKAFWCRSGGRAHRRLTLAVCLLGWSLGSSSFAQSRAEQPPGKSPTNVALATLLNVGQEGEANELAQAAWKNLVAQGVNGLIPTLEAFRDASPAAANWLRSAVSAVVEAERRAKRPLPAADLQAFVRKTTQHPAARRIAFELFQEADAPAAESLLLGLVNDPNLELRYDAIELRLAKAKADSPVALLKAYQELLPSVRDQRQAEAFAEALDKAGQPVNLTKFFNFVTEWQIIGPFDNTEGIGFNQAFPPERNLDLNASFPGKEGMISWKYVQAADTYGKIDLNRELGKVKFATAYAQATIINPTGQPVSVEFRASSPGATKIFLNQEALFARNVYHNNGGMDSFVGRGVLKPGENSLLLKICQNDQKQPWAQSWEFECRICDATGGRVELQQLIRRPQGTAPVAVSLSELKPEPKKPGGQ